MHISKYVLTRWCTGNPLSKLPFFEPEKPRTLQRLDRSFVPSSSFMPLHSLASQPTFFYRNYCLCEETGSGERSGLAGETSRFSFVVRQFRYLDGVFSLLLKTGGYYAHVQSCGQCVPGRFLIIGGCGLGTMLNHTVQWALVVYQRRPIHPIVSICTHGTRSRIACTKYWQNSPYTFLWR